MFMSIEIAVKAKKVIIVDDEPIILRSLKELLSDDYEAILFSSACVFRFS